MALADAVASAVAHWALDEASGTRADSVGSSDLIEMTTVGSAAGVFGNAADFESGETDRIEVADNAALSMGDVDFTVRFWVKFESIGTMVPLCKDNNSQREYGFYYDTGTEALIFYVFGLASEFNQVGATNFGALSAGTWYLVHAWHDAAANQIGIAVNAGTANTLSHSAGVLNGTSPFALGGRADGALYFDGLLDDVVVLKNYVLDADERAEDYDGGAGVAFEDWGEAGGGATVGRVVGRVPVGAGVCGRGLVA